MARVIYGETNKGADREAPKMPKEAQGKSIYEADSLFNTLNKYVDDAINFTSQWATNQEKWHKLRMRIKKSKTFPFVGSSNIRMPTAEISIRKVKAAIMGIVFGIRPIVQALPSPSGNWQVANKIEKLIDHLIMDVIGIEKIAEIAVDQSCEKGFYLVKPFWRRETIDRKEKININELPVEEVMAIHESPAEVIIPEIIKRFDVDLHDSVAEGNISSIEKAIEEIKSGNEEIELSTRDVIYNFPDVALASPERIYVPSDSNSDVQKLKCITHEFFMPLDEVKRCAELKGWDKDVVAQIDAFKDLNIDSLTDTQKDFREGIERMSNPSKLVRVWETYGWFDIDGDGKTEKSIVTSFPDFKQVARKVLIDTLSGKYPFVKMYYEVTDDRWFCHRGIPELLEDIIKEIDVQHNMKIDSQTIRNAPMFVYRAGMVNPNLVQMIPNQGIPIQGLQPLKDTLDVLDFHNPNIEFSYEREQMVLETKIQEMIGQVDFSLQSLINRRQPRTLGEVEQQGQAANRVFSLDSNHYINAFSELFSMVFELWCQYGDDEYEFNYFGEIPQGEKIRLTKEEIQGKYKIIVRGNDQNTNPQTKIQKAQQILAAVTNPILIQSGVVSPINIANGIKRYFSALDIENYEEIINLNPQPQQPDPAANIEPKFEDLTDGEKAQILAKKGIKVDAPGRFGNQNREVIMEAAKIASMVGGNDSIGGDGNTKN